MNDKKLRILSLDGGGIKGIYSLKILIELEKRYGKVKDQFDLICGTSTGGIIALGLALGRTSEEILEFYIKNGPNIFPVHGQIGKLIYKIRQIVLSNKYSNNELLKCLKSFFGDKRMKELSINVCIPAVNLTDGQGIIFKTPHSNDFIRDSNLKLVDVALATSAAPTYFPSHSISPEISGGLVDGGLWANNPALIGAMEALSYFTNGNTEFDSFSILSIGALSNNLTWSPRNHKKGSVVKWATKLFPLTISAQSNAAHNILKIAYEKKLFPMMEYIRLPEPAINPNLINQLTLDNATPKAVQALLDLANATVNSELNSSEIKSFFNKYNEAL